MIGDILGHYKILDLAVSLDATRRGSQRLLEQRDVFNTWA